MMNLDFDLFSIEKKYRIPQAGRVLVSEPFLPDENFRRSIVFLAEHNEKGTIGFVLNKPIKAHIHELVNDFPDVEFTVSLGGPVATDTLHYIHTLGPVIPDSKRVYRNIYWGGDYDAIKKMISLGTIGTEQIRFFVGYAGWGQGQLEREISENSWVATHIRPEMIMSGYQPEIWKEVLRSMGAKFRLWSGFPVNPGLN
ncbi:MAG: YqgE/AlgH family protein [Chlorobi bacterium]|nr:YqgE/AlgH family protein [Chlorobiota bacterium]